MRISAQGALTLAAVLDAGTMEAAAEQLHITPSAVSQRIRALEEELGRVLLVRTKPLRPADAAHAVVRFARQVSLLAHDAAADLGEGADVTSVPLAVNADSLATWFLPAIVRLAASRPVAFDLHRDDQDFTAAMLENGTVMGAVTSRSDAVSGCRVAPLGMLRYVAVAAPVYVERWLPGVTVPEPGGGMMDARMREALDAAPLIDFDRRDELQTRWLVGHDIDPSRPPRHRVPASHEFATAAELGVGWALLPALQAAAGLARGSLVPLGGPPIDVPLYWQQWNLTSPLLDAVAQEIIDEVRRALSPWPSAV